MKKVLKNSRPNQAFFLARKDDEIKLKRKVSLFFPSARLSSFIAVLSLFSLSFT